MKSRIANLRKEHICSSASATPGVPGAVRRLLRTPSIHPTLDLVNWELRRLDYACTPCSLLQLWELPPRIAGHKRRADHGASQDRTLQTALG